LFEKGKNSHFIILIHSNLYLELTTKKLSYTNDTTDIKNVIGKLKWHGCVEGFQTSTRHRGYLGCLSLTRDVRELNQGDSWLYDHTHQRIHYVRFTYKTDGKILFYMIILF
jgi:hypothetical protein